MPVLPIGETATRPLRGMDWTPYLIGIGIGVLSWAVFFIVNTPLGVTTSLAQLAAGAAAPVVGWDAVARNSYWAKQLPKLDYGTLFLVGTLLGGLVSALLARNWHIEKVPDVWVDRFGPSPAKRYAYAFAGGAIAMFGARMANGCTSGNGISGGLQLAVSGWVFLAAMFATGTLTAFLMFRSAR